MSDENYQLNTPRDSTGSVINPATEEKQDEMIAAEDVWNTTQGKIVFLNSAKNIGK